MRILRKESPPVLVSEYFSDDLAAMDVDGDGQITDAERREFLRETSEAARDAVEKRIEVAETAMEVLRIEKSIDSVQRSLASPEVDAAWREVAAELYRSNRRQSGTFTNALVSAGGDIRW